MGQSNLTYHIKEGFHSIFTHGLMSFAAVCVIVACLLIMGSFSLVAVDLDHNLSKLQDENEFQAYIDESLTEEQARALEGKLLAIDNVASVSFITRETAMEKFVADKDNALYQDLPPSVFRHRFSVHVTDIEKLRETVAAVAALPEVANYHAYYDVADGLTAARDVARGISFILVGVLLLISMFIIANTIKLATFHRREEIAIMKMCGATSGFIRWPFVIEGLILGLVGAILAFGLQWGVYALIENAVSDGLPFIELIPFKTLAPAVLGIFCGVGLLVGTLGSLLAIRRFLKV